MSVSETVYRWLHGGCEAHAATHYTHYVRERDTRMEVEAELTQTRTHADRLDSALTDSAQAHNEAEKELTAEREVVAFLQAELNAASKRIEVMELKVAGERARADQAEAARTAVEKLLADPLPLTRPHLENQGLVDAALFNVVLMRILLRAEGNRHAGSFYGEYVHQLADALQARVTAAFDALKTDHDPERVLDVLQTPLTSVPRPSAPTG
ncbi:hypothetical protein AB0I72_11395 [Nocardiopsis sp. NPDC049922]|uniref:hypothetical protein n=1 Tax=Nocardiopsis sp. NPDC049922 TaxID=3155157 RepID=UPI0033F190D3